MNERRGVGRAPSHVQRCRSPLITRRQNVLNQQLYKIIFIYLVIIGLHHDQNCCTYGTWNSERSARPTLALDMIFVELRAKVTNVPKFMRGLTV